MTETERQRNRGPGKTCVGFAPGKGGRERERDRMNATREQRKV